MGQRLRPLTTLLKKLQSDKYACERSRRATELLGRYYERTSMHLHPYLDRTSVYRWLAVEVRWNWILTWLGCVGLIALHYVLGITATFNKCAAFDEVSHITSGYSYNRYGDFRLQPENGILPQRWVALPWLWHELPFPTTEYPAWVEVVTASVGHLFFYKLGNDPDNLLLVGRSMNGLWSIAFGALLFCWTYRILGSGPAWLTLALWAFSPIFLTHDFIATSDSAAALFFLASVGGIWSAIHRLTWGRLIFSCIAIAALFLSKYSAPMILPIGLVMAAVRLIRQDLWHVQILSSIELRSRWKIFLAMILLASVFAMTTWCAIWVSYGMRYSMFNVPMAGEGKLDIPWDELLENPDTITRVVDVARKSHFLPEAYLYGFLYTHIYSQKRSAFFLGEFSTEGWRMFFPFCELVKTPTGTLILLILAAMAIIMRYKLEARDHRRVFLFDRLYRTSPLWILFVVYWLFAIFSHLNIGHRHILPAEGPLLMFGGIAAWWLRYIPRVTGWGNAQSASEPGKWWRSWRYPIPAMFTIVCFIGTISASLLTWPNYLAFFNLPSGGPRHAWKKLLDSSLDWGQELPSLRNWLQKEAQHHPINTPFYLSYFGTGNPDYYGIRATLLPCFLDYRQPSFPTKLEPGFYCISASMVQGLYTEFPGPWTIDEEKEYQKLRGLEALTLEPQFRAEWPKLTEKVRSNWIDAFLRYEQLRFTRLTHLLRRREPEIQINFSILIYRVDVNELARALDGPPDDWHSR